MRSIPHTCRLVALSLMALAGLQQAHAQNDSLLPVEQAYLLRAEAAAPGSLHLHWTIAPGYYLYRGHMKFTAGPGVALGHPQLPDGDKHYDDYLGEVETYHHAIDAQLPYTLAAGATRIVLDVQYQGCHEVDPKICYPPHTQHLELPAPTVAGPATLDAALARMGQPAGTQGTDTALPAEQAFHFDALASAPGKLLLRWTLPPGYYLYRDQTRLALLDAPRLRLGTPAWPPGVAHEDAHYGHTTVYYGAVELPVPVQGTVEAQHTVRLRATFQGCQENGLCYPPMQREVPVVLPPTPSTTGASAASSLTWLLALGALGGGLLLNLLPCVLPVLSLKVLGVLENSEERRALRRHALFYTLGVLLSFAALDLIAHAFGRGLGTQLQNPTMVAVLACVMLSIGLSLSGLWQFGLGMGGLGQTLANRRGPMGDFFTGILAVVVASPCTGPLMGPPVAFALTAPLPQSLLVFLLLGLGLALPLILIALVPGVARLLPRPGAWMETLKQLLAFPMYLTTVWLVWVLAKQRGADGVGLTLLAAVATAMALWWYERSRHRTPGWRLLVLPLALAAALPMALLARLPPPAITALGNGGVAYSPQKLAELRRSGTPVLVDMTADWCITCKANEHVVLDTEAFREHLRRTGAVYMVGDWTDANPTIEAFLKQYHSPGVPLYVMFPRGGGGGRQLPNVLTPAIVAQALDEAAR